MQILFQTLWVQQSHKRADDSVIAHILKWFLVERGVPGYFGVVVHDEIDSVIDISNPKH